MQTAPSFFISQFLQRRLESFLTSPFSALKLFSSFSRNLEHSRPYKTLEWLPFHIFCSASPYLMALVQRVFQNFDRFLHLLEFGFLSIKLSKLFQYVVIYSYISSLSIDMIFAFFSFIFNPNVLATFTLLIRYLRKVFRWPCNQINIIGKS